MPLSPNANGLAPEQRLRITFAVAGPARYVSHLDLARAWVRALRRLGVPLAYSKGFNPHPRISVAAPLPVGFAGERELLDLYLDSPVNPSELAACLQRELPDGLTLSSIEPVALQAPALPSLVVAADYVVSFYEPPPDLAERVQRLVAAESLPYTRIRKDKEVRFDLRPRILQAHVEVRGGLEALVLSLVHGPGGAARPEDILSCVGLSPHEGRIRRTGLVLASP
jgi:radical SAM-linked protein